MTTNRWERVARGQWALTVTRPTGPHTAQVVGSLHVRLLPGGRWIEWCTTTATDFLFGRIDASRRGSIQAAKLKARTVYEEMRR